MSNPFLGARPTDVNRFSEFTNLWIARYPSVRLWRDQRLFGRRDIGSDGLAVSSATAMATGPVRLAAEKHTAEICPNLVLVVVESWGLETDSSFAISWSVPTSNRIFGPVRDPAGHNRLSTGPRFPARCGSSVAISWGRTSCTPPNRICRTVFPAEFISLGYHNIAAHGMDGEMFNRLTWYSNVGFQEQWFRDQFRQQGLPDCPGAFVGTCDAAIAAWIGRRLGRKTPVRILCTG